MKSKNNKFNNNDLLAKIFEQRENEIYKIKIAKKLLLQRKKEYLDISIALDNIPNAFTETRKGIKDSIEKYLETINEIQGIENEKFYKEGFSDAIKLIFSCSNNTKTNSKYNI